MIKVPIELKIKYLSRRLADIQDVRESHFEDFSLVQRIGHQIKGNAVTFEVPQIACLGPEMEVAARRKDKDKISILISKMEHLIEAAQKDDKF
jgi:hypothetical protein